MLGTKNARGVISFGGSNCGVKCVTMIGIIVGEKTKALCHSFLEKEKKECSKSCIMTSKIRIVIILT